METAQQLVTSFRLHGGGLTVGAFGFSGGGSGSEGVSQPPSALRLDGPRVLHNLLGYALAPGARGVLLHLNNLENISPDHARKVADKLRAVRDQALVLEGLHLIVVGTTDAVATAVLHHPQVRSVFSDPNRWCWTLSPLQKWSTCSGNATRRCNWTPVVPSLPRWTLP